MIKSAAKWRVRLTLCWLAMLCAATFPAPAQTSAPASGSSVSNSIAARMHGTLVVDGPWRFQTGDDLRWAEPGFDDSAWSPVSLGRPLTEQGIDPYTGYGWYRIRLQAQQFLQISAQPGASMQANEALNLMLTTNSVGQADVFVNGIEAGHTKGMTDRPDMYVSPPLAMAIARPAGDGTVVLAIRTWAGPNTQVHLGLLSKVEVGAQADVADRLKAAKELLWDQKVIAGTVVSFLFFCVALLGATLYLAQRSHSEYLWLALLCLSVTTMGICDETYEMALMPLSIFGVLSLWAGRIFMAVTLEFVLRFTASEHKRLVRIVQACVLVIPAISLMHLERVYEYLSVTAEVVFCGLVSVLLYKAWRKGLHEAGVMLLPFILGGTADSIDTVLNWAATSHWIPEQFADHRFHMGPIEFSVSTVTYTVFLASLLAVILYRFIHVSQDEQRSAAEIDAARSVQAMLIPTQLPSNHNFMLESAYLPANGVGGDFFQVLPLKDDSMLIVVGDVSGKGLQAAMNASTLVGALRNELSSDPATVLNRLNNVLLGATGPDAILNQKGAASFATCVCARVYTDGKMTIANAGHLHPYRDGRELDLVADLPLGVIPDIHYEQASFQLNVGDRLIFLSDGVVEAANAQGELFGFERTQQVSTESARYIAQTAKRFGQTDDITVVSLYFAARSGSRAAHKVPQGV